MWECMLKPVSVSHNFQENIENPLEAAKAVKVLEAYAKNKMDETLANEGKK